MKVSADNGINLEENPSNDIPLDVLTDILVNRPDQVGEDKGIIVEPIEKDNIKDKFVEVKVPQYSFDDIEKIATEFKIDELIARQWLEEYLTYDNCRKHLMEDRKQY